ncbi:MAG TPA: amino acid adenylation domain-containing protein, partial [Longimicrobium sp.]
EQAERTPDAVAVVSGEESLTYRALDERANRLARHLVGLGVGPEARVGVCQARGPEMIVSLLAVLKAGGAYVPLDPAYPAERLAFTVSDSGAAVLLTEEPLRGLLPVPDGVPVVVVDGAARAEIAAESAENPAGGAAPGSLAYLIYTSGSTGVPKGVAIEHRSAVALLSWGRSVYSADELSGVLASTSISFDLSVYELFLPLSAGGRVIMVENALALPHSAAAGEVRLINTVPSAIAALLESGGVPAGVTTVNLAGEPLRSELVDALYAAGVERVYDLYGPSEDTTYSTCALRRAGGPATIGRPISNTRAYVLDAGMRPVPVGVPGELHLGGRGLARGYLGRPALTAERFVPDPFGAAGARLYRTGDRARWRADGTLEYLGRLDEQVKVRGYRIEPGEIEAVLRRHESVREGVVVAREDAPGDRRLVAYVVGRDDSEPQPSELRAHLAGRLPDYMVPSAFVVLDHLPLTPSGKVDRRALPAPDAARPEGDAGYAAPRTRAEEVLAGIWAEVLGLERVGVHDNFFELGGDSILSIQVVSRARAAGLRITPRQIFDHPTAAELAGCAGREGEADAEQGIVQGPVELTPIQRWFFDRASPAPHHWNLSVLLEVRRLPEPGVLERAVARVAAHHDALRMRFRREDGEWRQENAGLEERRWTACVDLSGLGEEEQRREVEREAARLQASLSLVEGRLLRAVAFARGEERAGRLLIVAHHLVMDGVSWRVLLEDLRRACEGAALPPKTTSFRRWAARLAEHVAAGGFEDELPYWLADER